jgi:hypothetical protein
MAVSRPQAVGRRVGVTDDLSVTRGDEIGIVAADDIEAAPPDVILARRFDLKRREPMKDVMRVDCGDRRDVILLTCANVTSAAVSRVLITTSGSATSSFARAATRAVFFVKELLSQFAI